MASSLCALHCAALPFVLALLPLVGLQFLAGRAFERGFVIGAATLATVVLLGGWRRHRRLVPWMLALPGLLLLLSGIWIDLGTSVVIHSLLVVTGGVLLACAHLCNLRYSRRRCACAT